MSPACPPDRAARARAKLRGKRRRLAAALVAAALALPSAGRAQDAEQRALEAVRKEIGALEQRISRQYADRDAAAQALKRPELEIAAAARELSRLQAELERQQARQRDLSRQADAANARLASERAALARQVRMTYMTGREEVFRLLLSQDSPARLGRMLVYYDYFNRARSERIAAVATQLRSLATLREEAEQVQRELAALEEAQSAEIRARERSREERTAVIAGLDASIEDAGNAIERLRAEERRLGQLVIQLAEALAGFPVASEEPFPRLQGQLAWPVPGRLAGDYGQPRAGGPLKWNGVLLATAQGTPVRAVYHGRVVFADWLPGLGLLIIVDHGDGYMSLYGHNEALLKEAGDWVRPGEAVAQVGDTGGRAEPSLYFEIRENGRPVNPHQWIPRPPAPQ
jgi:septal ring factor EnvC (AmiA/AmiB activator)